MDREELFFLISLYANAREQYGREDAKGNIEERELSWGLCVQRLKVIKAILNIPEE
jgi:hypothetical protein